MKTALIVRHVPYEGVAGFAAPVEAAGYALTRLDVIDPGFADADLVSPDLLILMGGPMSVYEQQAHPWIAPEIAKIATRLGADRPTLGVCLGAQLIAAALGATVHRNSAKEIGFAPITLSDAGQASPLALLGDVPMLHWHSDTFTRPEGVEWLASTPVTPHQAFRRGPNLLALQFHAEMGEDARFAAWLDYEKCPVRSAALADDYARFGPGAVNVGRQMIAAWLAGLG